MSKLVTDSVAKTIVRMALFMLAGTFAINMYNLTNAWFVSRLGADFSCAFIRLSPNCLYSHHVLEAKLVTESGMAFSIASAY